MGLRWRYLSPSSKCSSHKTPSLMVVRTIPNTLKLPSTESLLNSLNLTRANKYRHSGWLVTRTVHKTTPRARKPRRMPGAFQWSCQDLARCVGPRILYPNRVSETTTAEPFISKTSQPSKLRGSRRTATLPLTPLGIGAISMPDSSIPPAHATRGLPDTEKRNVASGTLLGRLYISSYL